MRNIVFGASESCINCYCLILLVFIFKYLYLFGLKRGLKILFGQFWSPKNLLLPMPGRMRNKKQLMSNNQEYVDVVTVVVHETSPW